MIGEIAAFPSITNAPIFPVTYRGEITALAHEIELIWLESFNSI